MHLDVFGLTYKERMFCHYYVLNQNHATNAAISAGYSKRSAKNIGHNVLRKPHIRKFLETFMREAKEKLGIDEEYKLGVLKKVADASLDGSASKEGIVNATGAVAAINEINKMDGGHAAEKKDSVVTLTNVDELLEDAIKDY